MEHKELEKYFRLQVRLRELCDEAGIKRPLSKREMAIGVLALVADPPTNLRESEGMDLGKAL